MDFFHQSLIERVQFSVLILVITYRFRNAPCYGTKFVHTILKIAAENLYKYSFKYLGVFFSKLRTKGSNSKLLLFYLFKQKIFFLKIVSLK